MCLLTISIYILSFFKLFLTLGFKKIFFVYLINSLLVDTIDVLLLSSCFIMTASLNVCIVRSTNRSHREVWFFLLLNNFFPSKLMQVQKT